MRGTLRQRLRTWRPRGGVRGPRTGRALGGPHRVPTSRVVRALRRVRTSRAVRALHRVRTARSAPALAAGVLAFAALVETALRSFPGSLPLALFLALGTTLPLAVIRTHPFSAAAVSSVSALLALAPYGLFTLAGLPALLACLHAQGLRAPRLPAALLPLPFLGYAVAGPGDRPVTVLVCLSALAAAGAGLARRALAEARAHSATERAIAETLQEHAARGERARIARELHDVVAHHISMIAVQAETARLTTEGMPPAGAERLLAIGDTARTALTEMRRLLGVLREDAGPPAAPERRPQPGLRQLAGLVDEAREASGAGTRLIVSGRVRPLDQGVELTAYRIVQEALTNARRHAPGAAVDVSLRYTDRGLRLRVRDNGPGAGRADDAHGARDARDARGAHGAHRANRAHRGSGPSGRGGHGLTGMRERAAMVGGELTSGPAPGGGFQIEALLPAPDTGSGNGAGTGTDSGPGPGPDPVQETVA